MVANPSRGQVKKEIPARAEKVLASRDRFVRPVPNQPAHSSHSGPICLAVTRGLLSLLQLSATRSIYGVNLHRVNHELIGSGVCVPMAFKTDSLFAPGQ